MTVVQALLGKGAALGTVPAFTDPRLPQLAFDLLLIDLPYYSGLTWVDDVRSR